MSDDTVRLCQELRDEAAEAVRLAAAISDKNARARILGLARDLTVLAIELEVASTMVVVPVEAIEQTGGPQKPKPS